MTVLQTALGQDTIRDWRTSGGRLLALLFTLCISIVIILGWEHIERLGVYGYPAVFLVTLFGSATLVLPAPSFAFVFAAGSTLDPVGVAIVAGFGAAIGELTGYIAGYSGQCILEAKPLYHRIESWMNKSGFLVIFLLGAIPNPAFDAGGFVAGILRMPMWQFIIAAWLGKSLRFSVLAYLGLQIL
jgi:membrane protein YqaA with SNARE-associated domain